jgi:hypothetical protein
MRRVRPHREGEAGRRPAQRGESPSGASPGRLRTDVETARPLFLDAEQAV